MKVALIPNSGNPQAMSGAFTLITWLERQGVETVLFEGPNSRPAAMPLEESDNCETGISSFVEGCGLVIALGGDGTVLRAARMIGGSGIPLLSINYGTLGFLASAPAEEMIDALATVLSGEVEPIRRATLLAEVVMDDQTVETFFALNEIVAQRGNTGRIVHFSYSINGVEIAKMRADGILVATATGSTGYALSAGGPLLSPHHQGLLVLPIAPHTLTNRAFVCASPDVIELDFSSKPDQNLSLCVDGLIREEKHPLHITVRKGYNDLRSYQLSSDGFLETAARVFFGKNA